MQDDGPMADRESQFFALENVVEEAVYHEYFECNMCKVGTTA